MKFKLFVLVLIASFFGGLTGCHKSRTETLQVIVRNDTAPALGPFLVQIPRPYAGAEYDTEMKLNPQFTLRYRIQPGEAENDLLVIAPPGALDLDYPEYFRPSGPVAFRIVRVVRREDGSIQETFSDWHLIEVVSTTLWDNPLEYSRETLAAIVALAGGAISDFHLMESVSTGKLAFDNDAIALAVLARSASKLRNRLQSAGEYQGRGGFWFGSHGPILANLNRDSVRVAGRLLQSVIDVLATMQGGLPPNAGGVRGFCASLPSDVGTARKHYLRLAVGANAMLMAILQSEELRKNPHLYSPGKIGGVVAAALAVTQLTSALAYGLTAEGGTLGRERFSETEAAVLPSADYLWSAVTGHFVESGMSGLYGEFSGTGREIPERLLGLKGVSERIQEELDKGLLPRHGIGSSQFRISAWRESGKEPGKYTIVAEVSPPERTLIMKVVSPEGMIQIFSGKTSFGIVRFPEKNGPPSNSLQFASVIDSQVREVGRAAVWLHIE